jgi:ABC-type lipoprotein export system ATPase subunit
VTPAVGLRDVFRIYATAEGSTAALQGLNLEIAERELVVVLGPSGSGKSTLLRILAGLDRASAGSVRVFETELGALGGRELDRYRHKLTGYADQHYSRALAPELAVEDLVGLRLRLSGSPSRDTRRRAHELLERVGLLDRRRARAIELSGGEQQRVAVCAAVAHRPRLFLADEPTGELDHGNAVGLYALLSELARDEECTTVIVSHDPESATIADRVVHVRDGRVSAEALRHAPDDEEIVIGRGGWLRLSETLLRQASITTRAEAQLDGKQILIRARGVVESLDGGGASPPAAPLRIRPDVVRVHALDKSYGSGTRARVVFDGLEASFDGGCFTVVTGPSGSGKTSLLNLVAGLDLPDAGDVEVLGTPLGRLDRSARAAFRARHVAYVGQDPVLVPFLTAAENVQLGLSLRGLERAEGLARAERALGAVDLTLRAGQRVSRLSAGERERVAVARALAAEPAVLLADEPTARLDQANTLLLVELLTRWARTSGAAVICATHDTLLRTHADREVALDVAHAVSMTQPSSKASVGA